MKFTEDVANYFKLAGKGKFNRFYVLVYAFHPRLMPIAVFRISAFLFEQRLGILANIFSFLNQVIFGLEISPKIKIGKGLFMPHCRATVIGAKEIGDYVTIYQNVTIGAKFLDFNFDMNSRPTIGDNVVIGTGSTILGPINISNGTRIGPHCLVNHDLAPDTRFKATEKQRVNRIFNCDGSQRIDFTAITEGLLSTVQLNFPFEIKQISFLTFSKNLNKFSQGQKGLNQVIIAKNGRCTIEVDDGSKKIEYVLDDDTTGLLLTGLVWFEITNISEDCKLLSITDQKLEKNFKLSTHEDFIKFSKQAST